VTHVVVIGGGPAGCAVTRRLALDGTRVTQFVAGTVAGREGLSRRTLELLREDGFGDLASVVTGPVPRGGHWGDGRSVSGEEWLVDRERLAAAMRAATAAVGVAVHDDLVEDVTGAYPEFLVRTRSGSEVSATCVVDARGRRGAELHGPTLLALGQAFQAATPLPPATAIHPLSWGWCWIVTNGPNLWIQLAGQPGDGRPETWLARATAELPALATVLVGAVPAGDPVARPSHARRGIGPVRDGIVRAGDAAVGMDPLSGQGVYEALRGARAAAAAVRSLIAGVEPALVARFLHEREDALWERIVTVASSFYSENAGLGAFWTGTAAAYRALLQAPAPIRTSIERRPVLDGDRIREHDVIVTAAQPRGVWQVDGVPVVDLIHYIERAGDATPGGAAAALARPQAAILAAARWLREAGAWPERASQVLVEGG
jgi:flavin-dependent dehydrogenase